jgi:hypothetical protein
MDEGGEGYINALQAVRRTDDLSWSSVVRLLRRQHLPSTGAGDAKTGHDIHRRGRFHLLLPAAGGDHTKGRVGRPRARAALLAMARPIVTREQAREGESRRVREACGVINLTRTSVGRRQRPAVIAHMPQMGFPVAACSTSVC